MGNTAKAGKGRKVTNKSLANRQVGANHVGKPQGHIFIDSFGFGSVHKLS